MTTLRAVTRVAADSGFRPEVVEKVLRLRGILQRLDRHPITRGAWLLKGGTELNLLYLDIPRLSVDIDLNFVGAADLEGLQAARPEFEAALASVCEREGCTIRRAPGEHAGGKFRMRYASVLGGSQNLEVDVSYVARVPLLGTQRLATRFPAGDPIEVPTLTLLELAAGKFTERRFLDRLQDEGVIDAEALHSDPGIQDRVRAQPMLQWKALNIRKFQQRDA